jgi:hypothetical protein
VTARALVDGVHVSSILEKELAKSVLIFHVCQPVILDSCFRNLWETPIANIFQYLQLISDARLTVCNLQTLAEVCSSAVENVSAALRQSHMAILCYLLNSWSRVGYRKSNKTCC